MNVHTMLRHSPTAAVVLALAALIAPVRRSSAQDARPPEPDTAPARNGTSAAPVYRRSLSGLGLAQPTSDGEFVVLLASGPTAKALDTLRVRSLDGLDAECRERAMASDLPAGDTASASLGGQYLVVVVTGARKGTATCETGWNLSPVSVWHGAMLPAGANTLTRAPLATRLRIDGAAVSPILAYRRPTFERTDAGWRQQGTQLRYYYDMSVVAPRSDGNPREIVLEIWDRAAAPTRFEVPAGQIERLALEFVGWTLATTPKAAADVRLDLRPIRRVARPLAAILDTARVDVVAGGLRAVTWASAMRETSQSSDVLSRFVAAEALLALDQPDLAHSLVASMQREHPCLVPPSGSSPRIVALSASNDRSARCQPVSSSRAAALSIVPGLGNLAVDDRRSAAIGAALVVGAFVQAVRVDSRLKQQYKLYQAAQDPVEIKAQYESVRDLRAQRGVAIGVGVGLWALDALSAMWGAHALERKIADDRF